MTNPLKDKALLTASYGLACKRPFARRLAKADAPFRNSLPFWKGRSLPLAFGRVKKVATRALLRQNRIQAPQTKAIGNGYSIYSRRAACFAPRSQYEIHKTARNGQ